MEESRITIGLIRLLVGAAISRGRLAFGHTSRALHRTLCVSFVRAVHNSVERWERGRRGESLSLDHRHAGVRRGGRVRLPDQRRGARFGTSGSVEVPRPRRWQARPKRVPRQRLRLRSAARADHRSRGRIRRRSRSHVRARRAAAEGEPFVRPSISAVGGLRTENGTRGWLARTRHVARRPCAHDRRARGHGRQPRVFWARRRRSDHSAGSRLFGEGAGRRRGGNYRLGDTEFWMGLRYTAVDTRVSREPSVLELPNVPLDDYDLRLGALTPSLTLDRRDNFFTPIRGWYVDLSVPMYRESLGSGPRLRDGESHWDVLPAIRESPYFSACAGAANTAQTAPRFSCGRISRCAECRRFSIRASERPNSRRSSVGNSAHAGASSVSWRGRSPKLSRGTRARGERIDGRSRISVLDRAPPWLAPRCGRSGRPRRRHLLCRVRQRVAAAVVGRAAGRLQVRP